MARAKSLFHSAKHAISFLARSAARNAVTEQLRDQGVRVSLVPTRDIHAQADEYLRQHQELFDQARERAERMGWVEEQLSGILVTPDWYVENALFSRQVAQIGALKRLSF